MTGALVARLREVQLAVMLLTRLPAGRLHAPIPSLAAAAWAYPLIGLVTGATLWAGLAAGLALGFSPAISALAAVAAVALLTGGLHLDGLADLADGLGGGRDGPHALEIMRDSRIGSYGALALMLNLGLMTTALAQLGTDLRLADAMILGLGARLAMLGVLVALPAARDDGLGQQTRGAGARSLLPGGGLCAVLLILSGGGAMLLALAAMGAAAAWIAWAAQRRIGGQTGDVLGASVALSETAGLLALSLQAG
ncbi:MAG: adenosylcobinamide-GDP ribazoletransferase [Roseinatronobacter sp.]